MTFSNNYEVFYRQSISNGKEKLLEMKEEEPKVTNTNISVFPWSMPWIKRIDPECLRRSRLSTFTLNKNDAVSSICRFLAEMEITCSEIVATSTNATAASISQLLLILKPERISLVSHSSDRYKALHQSKTLESVIIWMDADDTKEILRIISCPHLRCHVEGVADKHELLRTVFQVLLSQTQPNLQSFYCEAFLTTSIQMTPAELAEDLIGYDIFVFHRYFIVKFTQSFPKSYFVISLDECLMKIEMVDTM